MSCNVNYPLATRKSRQYRNFKHKTVVFQRKVKEFFSLHIFILIRYIGIPTDIYSGNIIHSVWWSTQCLSVLVNGKHPMLVNLRSI